MREAIDDAAARAATWTRVSVEATRGTLELAIEDDGAPRASKLVHVQDRRVVPGGTVDVAGNELCMVVILCGELLLMTLCLTREGIVHVLRDGGIDVVAECVNADDLLRHVELTRPDVAVVDIRMPPTHTDEGLVAAQQIRRRIRR